MLHQTLLGKRTEILKTVYVNPATLKVLAVIDWQVPVSAEHKRIIVA